MSQYRPFLLFLILALSGLVANAQRAGSLMVEPFTHRVFIEERGQFADKLTWQGTEHTSEILYGVENAEFQAYFNKDGILFRFAERKVIPKGERVKVANEPEVRGIETIWHTSELKWVGASTQLQVSAQSKAHEYYNYTSYAGKPNINFVPAYNEVVYEDLYDGVDLIFELPEEGGIKYRFELDANIEKPDVKFQWSGVESLKLDAEGDLLIKTEMTLLKDKAPTAFSRVSNTPVEISYRLNGTEVEFDFHASDLTNTEGLVIDPWVVNTNYPAINAAHDIQEDAAGNVVVLGNHTDYQVQKFSPTGVLQWTYITNSVFLGDIAVDNPGNVYIVGGYSAGKRQKLNPAGVQQWTFSGLMEEWRLAFNYSKTQLTVGGYFNGTPGDNLGRFDVNTGAISNRIIYGEETRAIATDCNGDMYSLHVTFGATGAAASNILRKTNADFTPAGSLVSGFLLSESEATAGYAPNPGYSAPIYQGFNGIVVSGLYLYISDGASIRRANKNTLTFLNTAAVPGGAKLKNSGMAADLCGNIYVGSQNGIAMYDSVLNFIQTIPTPGAVYDIISSATGDLLACGFGFVSSMPVTCNPPPAIVATSNNACDGTGSVTIDVAGGLAPYTFEWQPGGQTSNPITGLAAGVYTYTVNDAFCRTYIDSVEIYENPVPTFGITGINTANVNANSICLGETVQFSDNSTSNDGNIISWNWDFGDGAFSTDQNPTHSYTSAGTFDVKVVVTTQHGCTDSITDQVIVDPLPVADFTATNACLGTDNVFTDQSSIASGSIASWAWDFDDGNTSTQQNPTHQYGASGTYSVVLTTTSASGCSSSYSADAEVYDLPQPNFSYPTTCVNDPTALTDASTDGDWPITTWQWNAEGQSLSGPTVQHTFSAEGTFPVQLTTTDQFGCVDSITQQVTISVRPAIALSVNDDCANEQFVFANSSTISSGIIDSTHWDMGDGATYTTISPTHTYVNAGFYTVALYMESELGCSADTSFQVQVYPNPIAGLQWQNVCEGTTTIFNETSSVAAPGVLQLSDWTMGDGSVFNDSNLTSYDYAGFGDYSVQLSVETQHGCTDSETFVVSVHAMPTADFSFGNICETDSVLFTDQSAIAQGNIAVWQWDFGNGQTHSGQNPPYQTYAADGFYPVELTVTSDSGCVHVFDDVIEIYPTPIANFTFDSVCYPLAVQFTDLSDPNGAYAITQWGWAFSDGQSSTVASPAMGFPQYGAYNATLTITNAAGCKDDTSLGDALVHPVPVADYTANMQHCFLETLSITDQSTLDVLSDDQIISWVYDLGDGTPNITAPDGTHNYASAGFYDLELTVTTNHGCEHSVSRSVEVFPLPQVAFSANPKEGCDPLYVQFTDQTTIAAPYSLSQWNWTVDTAVIYTDRSPTNLYDPAGLAPNEFSTYDVKLVVTSANGCVDSLSYADHITVHPVPQASFSVDPEKLATIINPLFKFTDLSTINVTSWNWSFGDGLGSTEQSPEYTYTDIGTYHITLTVTTDFGCADTVSYVVEVEPYFSFYIPSAFTPNDDRVNDLFFGAGDHLKSYNMKIFDRWGEMIFESNEQSFKWDGSYKGAPVEAGEYVYRFDVVDWTGKTHVYTGGVMLLR